MLPMLVHKLTECLPWHRFQRLLTAVTELFHEMQIAQHVFIVLLCLRLLVFQDTARGARKARKEQQQVVLEVEHGIHAELQRLDGHACHPDET